MNIQDQIHDAARRIKAGQIVAFPTETVYGLGASAFDSDAIKEIYHTKGRPLENPLIVHIHHRSELKKIVKSIPPQAELLMDAFWPGPLTIIFPKKDSVPPIISAGLPTVGVRMPSHPIARDLIKECGTPIVAPSANPSGKPSATHHNHVYNYFGEAVFCIKGGPTEIGIESTVISLHEDRPVILRAGAVTAEEISHLLETEVHLAQSSTDIPLSPGMKYKHYAPNAPLELIYPTDNFQAVLDEAASKYSFVGILASTQLISSLEIHDNVLTQALGDKHNLAEISRNLFDRLHAFDETKVKIILAETFPSTGIGIAIMDKLTRASQAHLEHQK